IEMNKWNTDCCLVHPCKNKCGAADRFFHTECCCQTTCKGRFAGTELTGEHQKVSNTQLFCQLLSKMMQLGNGFCSPFGEDTRFARLSHHYSPPLPDPLKPRMRWL